MAKELTPEFRVGFPAVFKPRKNEQNGQMEYSVQALFPKGADLSKLKAVAKQACIEKWGEDPKRWPEPLKNPFRKQEELTKKDSNKKVIYGKDGKPVLREGAVEGAIFCNFKSKQRPAVVDEQVQLILDESQFYAGCYARATVNAKAYDTAGNRGVSLYLQNVQKTRDGESLGGRSKPEEDFEPIAGAAEEVGVHTAGDLFN